MTVTSHKKWTPTFVKNGEVAPPRANRDEVLHEIRTSYYNSISAQSQARQTARPQESASPQQSWVRRYAGQLLGFIGRKSHSAP